MGDVDNGGAEVRARLDEALPPLAWCARVGPGGADVVHGAMVVTSDRLVHDGVWAGDLDGEGILGAHTCGSGLAVVGGRLHLFTPDTPTDHLVVAQDGTGLVVANSMAFLLEVLGDALDPTDIHVRDRNLSAERGVRLRPIHHRLASGRRVRVVLGEIGEVAADGRTVHYRHRAPARPVRDFHDYRDRLARTVAAVLANAADPRRATPLAPLLPLSTGYDSSAVAVLAAEAGLTEAVTLLRPEGGVYVDHPQALADVLGLHLEGIERNLWLDRTDLPEAEIAAAGVTMMDVALLSLEDRLHGRVLITGYSGDTMWDRNNFRVGRDVIQPGVLSGRGLAEHRLRVGYVVFAPPAIDHTAHPSIRALTRSAEMAPWSVGGVYDRPIARRIVEEAGVPRGAFAVRKYAGGARVGSSRVAWSTDGPTFAAELGETFSPAAVRSYTAHLDGIDRGASRRAQRAAAVAHLAYDKALALEHHAGVRLDGSPVRTVVPRRLLAALSARGQLNPDLTAWLPHWGTTVVRERYRGSAPTAGAHDGADAPPQRRPRAARRRAAKRAVDVLGASAGLVVAAVPMAAIAVAVARSMGRPVLFRQIRPGLHGEPFELVKFRSMRDGDAPDEERLTDLGRVLRATSLDELPELWNVLRGDMSLVGPRPLLMAYLDRYSPAQARRHEVRPGLTGLAQVSGRNLTGWDDRLAMDVEYVDTWTLAGDLRIMARTVAAVVRRHGIAAEGEATMREFTGPSAPLAPEVR